MAHGVHIFDNDSHPIDPLERQLHFRMIQGIDTQKCVNIGHSPILIGENSWLGLNSIITKGVSIGDNAIVASGSVVAADVPHNTIAGGNPGKILKEL